MKTAAFQMDILWESRKENFKKVTQFAQTAANTGAELLVLPEMFSTGFSMDTEKTSESINGETPNFMRETAAKCKTAIIGGFVLQDENKQSFNCALAVDQNGNDLALYSKTYLFSHMNEDKHHSKGNGPVVFEYQNMKCACFICYDLRFPELFRSVCRKIDAAFIIASWPASRSLHWQILLKARAIENQIFVVGVNRTGTGNGLLFSGGSAIIDPLGTVEAELQDQEGLLEGYLLPQKVKEVRASFPFLNDMRSV